MTRIKLCGLTRPCDIEAANQLSPEYVGFVLAPKSRRQVTPQKAKELKRLLAPHIQAVGVFVREDPKKVAKLLNGGIIDMAQLHGGEDEDYIKQLRTLTHKPIIKAFSIDGQSQADQAEQSSADFVLLDSGKGGTGMVFDWDLARNIKKPYFLAGGLCPGNVGQGIKILKPYGVDVSSGIETNGSKDTHKMAEFIAAVRKEDGA